MNETYKHSYTDLTVYNIIEIDKHGGERLIDDNTYKSYVKFCETNTPEKVSGDRFITIVDGEVILDPNKDAILAQEPTTAQNQIIREQLRLENDVVLRHFEQEVLVKLNVIAKADMSLTDEEWEALLTARQTTRDTIGDN